MADGVGRLRDTLESLTDLYRIPAPSAELNKELAEYLNISDGELQTLYYKAQNLHKHQQNIKLTELGSEMCGGCWLRPPISLESTLLEKHHIVPRALGGTNEKSNITKLCPTCHALAHVVIRLGRMQFWTASECHSQIQKIRKTMLRNRFGRKNP